MVDNLTAGYGSTPILRDFTLQLGGAQSLCLIGPNGAGKSTLLNAVYGLADIRSGSIWLDGENVTYTSAHEKLKLGMAYVLQESSVFPEMSVYENIWLGGYSTLNRAELKNAVERVFSRFPRLADRRRHQASVLSGGERRLLEIARALMLQPRLLLVDEPSIGLEPRYVEDVFETLLRLKDTEDLSILMAEQNILKALDFADFVYVLSGGQVAMAARSGELDPNALRAAFLGG